MTSAPPVAQEGMDAKMGAKKTEMKNMKPVVIAVMPVRPPSAVMHSCSRGQQMRQESAGRPLTATISFHGGWLPAAAPAFAFVAVAFLVVDFGFASVFFAAFLVVFASAFLVSALALVAFARADSFLFVAPSSSSDFYASREVALQVSGRQFSLSISPY